MVPDRSYTLASLIGNLAALSIEGILMVAGITWLLLQKHEVVKPRQMILEKFGQ